MTSKRLKRLSANTGITRPRKPAWLGIIKGDGLVRLSPFSIPIPPSGPQGMEKGLPAPHIAGTFSLFFQNGHAELHERTDQTYDS